MYFVSNIEQLDPDSVQLFKVLFLLLPLKTDLSKEHKDLFFF